MYKCETNLKLKKYKKAYILAEKEGSHMRCDSKLFFEHQFET